MKRSGRSRRRRSLLTAVALLIEPLAMKLRGYPLGGQLIVRCRRGHLFTTIWIPEPRSRRSGSAGGACGTVP
jgi:hypothetical protein